MVPCHHLIGFTNNIHWNTSPDISVIIIFMSQKLYLKIQFNRKVTNGFPSQKCQNTSYVESISLSWCLIVRRAGLLWSQQDFEWL